MKPRTFVSGKIQVCGPMCVPGWVTALAPRRDASPRTQPKKLSPRETFLSFETLSVTSDWLNFRLAVMTPLPMRAETPRTLSPAKASEATFAPGIMTVCLTSLPWPTEQPSAMIVFGRMIAPGMSSQSLPIQTGPMIVTPL